MECREALEHLNDEIDGRLAAADARRLEEHVAACAACAAERRALASMRAAFRALPKEAAPAGFRAGVMASLPRGRALKLPAIVGWIAAAAAVVVVAITLVPHDPSVSEKEVARVFDRDAAPPEAAAAAGPPPVLRPPAGEPVVPPRPGAAGARARAAEEKVAQEADEEHDSKRRDVAQRTPAPAAEVPAAPPASPKPPAPSKPAESGKPAVAEAAKSEDDATASLGLLSGAAAPAVQVRYVVFRDAVSADRFAAALAAADGALKKDKAKESAPPPAPAPAPAAKGDGGGGGGSTGGGAAPKASSRPAPPADQPQFENVVLEAAFLTRRVVARTPLPSSVADADLAGRAAAAGGALVPAEDQPKFAELLDAPAAQPEGGAAAKSAPDARDGKSRQMPAPPADAGLVGRTAAPPVVVVIVVLEPPPAGKR